IRAIFGFRRKSGHQSGSLFYVGKQRARRDACMDSQAIRALPNEIERPGRELPPGLLVFVSRYRFAGSTLNIDNAVFKLLAYAAAASRGNLTAEGVTHMAIGSRMAAATMHERPSTVWKRFKKQKVLHLFVGLGIVFLLVFSYTPMFGILMAFKQYSISDGIR